VRPIQQFVNAAFETEMTGDAESGQAEYSPLEQNRPGRDDQPAIVALPAPRRTVRMIRAKRLSGVCRYDCSLRGLAGE
jgi:hypothetical protein